MVHANLASTLLWMCGSFRLASFVRMKSSVFFSVMMIIPRLWWWKGLSSLGSLILVGSPMPKLQKNYFVMPAFMACVRSWLVKWWQYCCFLVCCPRLGMSLSSDGGIPFAFFCLVCSAWLCAPSAVLLLFPPRSADKAEGDWLFGWLSCMQDVSCIALIGPRVPIPLSVFSLYFADFQFLFLWGCHSLFVLLYTFCSLLVPSLYCKLALLFLI